MKLYDCKIAPNPRRTRIFIQEKGLDIPAQEVDILGGENLQPAYLAINSMGLLPALELDDGTAIAEVPAICRYLEALYPEPNLMGSDPKETAVIESWERFAEMVGMNAVGECFRNQMPAFADRGLPGMDGVPQIPELVERGKKRIAVFYKELNQRFAKSEYLAGDRFTFADITCLCVVDFSKAIKQPIPDEDEHTQRWYAAVSTRPSASA